MPEDDSGLSLPDEAEESKLAPLKAKPKTDTTPEPIWTLLPHDKQVVNGWEALARDTPAHIINAYDWLSQCAMTPRGSRCFALRHKAYAGHWCYEVSSGDRLYYKPDAGKKTAIVWYVGPHPSGIPKPPKGI